MNRIDSFLSYKWTDENEIPKIPLYMDQVTTYIDECFESLKLFEEEKILTKTMINNYVKAGVVEQPVKKKYSKSQIQDLMMIYQMKQVVSIKEVSDCLKLHDRDDLYRMFSTYDEKVRNDLSDRLSNNPDKEDLIIQLLIQSSIQKRLAELLIQSIEVKEDE